MVIFKNNKREFNAEHAGSFLNEHFFARTRMMSNNFDTYQRFLQVFDKIVLTTALRHEINATRSHAKYMGADIPPKCTSLCQTMVNNCKRIAKVFIKKSIEPDIETNEDDNRLINYFSSLLLKLDQLESQKSLKHPLTTDNTSFVPIRNLSEYERFAVNSAKFATLY